MISFIAMLCIALYCMMPLPCPQELALKVGSHALMLLLIDPALCSLAMGAHLSADCLPRAALSAPWVRDPRCYGSNSTDGGHDSGSECLLSMHRSVTARLLQLAYQDHLPPASPIVTDCDAVQWSWCVSSRRLSGYANAHVQLSKRCLPSLEYGCSCGPQKATIGSAHNVC